MARLTPITSKNQVAAKDQAIVDSIVASRGALQGPFTMFLHSPELAGRLAHLGAYVRFEGSLDMRVRVLAAMTVARELEAMYVWGAQTGGARKLGVRTTAAAFPRRTRRSSTSPASSCASTAWTTRP
jgi:4-carboxymuconolactone decarboxylase